MSRPPTTSLLREPPFVVALVIAVVVALGFGLIVPILPVFARRFGVGLFAVTAVVAAFSAVRLVSNVWAGALADRVGARIAVGVGAIVVGISSLLTAGAQTYWQLVALRGAGGFGSALFFTALLALIVRLAPPNQRGRAVGMLQGAFLVGIAVGPTVGGLLAEPLGLRWPFVVYAGFCVAAGTVALVFLPRMRPSPAAADAGGDVFVAAPGAEGDGAPGAVGADVRRRSVMETLRGGRVFIAEPAFVAALVMMVASRWAASGVRFSLVPVYAEEVVGATQFVIGLALTLAAVTQAAMLWPAGKVSDTLGRRALAAPSYLAFALVAALLGTVQTVPAFLVVLALYGVATGLTAVTPPAIVADVVPPEQTGLGIGVLNTAADLGSVLGPLVSGALAEAFGYAWGFGASAALLAVGALFAVRMRETLPEHQAT